MTETARDPGGRVTVVVLTHNRRDELLRTLSRLHALPERPPVIVVDSASVDGTAEAVRHGFPDVDLVRVRRNVGAAASVVRRHAFLEAGGFEPRFFLGGEEELLAADLATRGWSIAYVAGVRAHHHPSPHRDSAGRRRLLARNALWFTWLRRPARRAITRTVEIVAESRSDRARLGGCLDAIAGLPWALTRRCAVPRAVEQLIATIERTRVRGPRSASVAPPLLSSGSGGSDMDSVSYRTDTWSPWPVSWSALWIGALAALAAALLIGLIGTAVGAHQLKEGRIVTTGGLRLLTIVFSVAGAFFSAVIGGWVAARVAGIQRAETAMLHGAIVWLLGVPMLLLLGGLGLTGYFGSWYVGFLPAARTAADAVAMRNAALGGVTALLIGLIGGVIGGWMASGEPMTLAARRLGGVEGRRRRDIAA